MARVHIRSLGSQSTRLLALLALAASVLTVGLLSVSAQSDEQTAKIALETAKPAPTTTLVISGTGSRSVERDGTIARFSINVLDPSAAKAASTGNNALVNVKTALEMGCNDDNPDQLCVSGNHLQTISIRIYEDFDWIEGQRTSLGFRYVNSVQARMEGVEQAGLLIDAIIQAGGDHVRLDDLSFTSSRRAETQKLALLDAIDDAQETADLMVDHMGYEIVRIVEITPPSATGSFRAYGEEVEQAAMADDGGFVPTPVFGGSEPVNASVRIVFEIRPLPEETEESE